MLFYKKKEKQSDKVSRKVQNHDRNRKVPLRTNGAEQQLLLTKENAFYRRVSRCASASLTVEAAVILPLFFFAFLIWISIMDLYRYQSMISTAVQDRVKELGVYAYAAGGENLLSDGVCTMTAGKYIPEEVKENGSFQWIGSGYRNGYIDLKGSYYWKPPIAFPGIGKIKLAVRAGVRPWTGSSFREASEEESSTRMVYLTENGSVYHNHADCSYLDLTILLEKKSRIAALRNKSGGRYYPCEKCGRKKGGDTVWITQYGTRYHTDSGCSGLQRKVRMVPEEEAAGKCLCSRCAKKSA